MLRWNDCCSVRRIAIETRADEFETNFTAAIARLKQDIDPERLAQEMAILAVKSDVTEEIDRLMAHIAAARTLLDVARACRTQV